MSSEGDHIQVLGGQIGQLLGFQKCSSTTGQNCQDFWHIRQSIARRQVGKVDHPSEGIRYTLIPRQVQRRTPLVNYLSTTKENTFVGRACT
jgi:hypothetical protein